MRRKRFTLEISNVAWLENDDEPAIPTLDIAFDGSASSLRGHLADRDEGLGADETDVAVRLRGEFDDPDAEGVVALTDRVTGDYIVEVNVEAGDLATFLAAAHRYGEEADDTARYRVRVTADGEPAATYEKRTLLVYSREGELLRQHSLIPSGVEI